METPDTGPACRHHNTHVEWKAPTEIRILATNPVRRISKIVDTVYGGVRRRAWARDVGCGRAPERLTGPRQWGRGCPPADRLDPRRARARTNSSTAKAG